MIRLGLSPTLFGVYKLSRNLGQWLWLASGCGWGSGCGCDSVGRAVASNSRGPRLESSHRQKFVLNIYYQLY